MKILLAASGPTLESTIDERFARAGYFLIYDDSADKLDIIDNNKELSHGAGPQAVQLAIDNQASVILSAMPGENAIKAIKAANIKIYQANGMVAKVAIEKLKLNQLEEL